MRLPFANYVKAHHISHAALTVGALVAAILFFVVGVGLRLLIGPVSLGPLRGTLAEAIRQALPGITLQYDTAAIEWTRDQGRVNLVVLGTRIYDSRGQVVAQAPKADIDLAARPFLSGKFVVQRITLVGVKLTLVRMKTGGLRLGVEKAASSDDIIARLSDVIEAKSSSTSSLQSFAVRDADLGIYDEATGLYLHAPHAALLIRSKGEAIGTTFDSDVEAGGRRAHMKADLTLPPETGPVSGTLSVTNLDLRGLGAAAPIFAGLKNVALVANVSTRFAFAAGGKLTSADVDLSASGQVPVALLKDGALHVNALGLAAHYDGQAGRFHLVNAVLDAREVRMRAQGDGTLVFDGQNKLASASANIAATRLGFTAPGLFAQPVMFDAFNASGGYDVAARKLSLTRAVLSAPGFSLNTIGAVTFAADQAPGLALSGSLNQLPVRTLLHYWPLPVAPGAREWIGANVFAGSMGPLNFSTNLTPGQLDEVILPDNGVRLSFTMRGIEANYLVGLSHLTGVSGSALLTGDAFSADFTGGRVGNLTIRDGHAAIPTLHVHGTVGEFTAHADGSMPDIMTLIDMKPLGYPTRFGIDPARTGGTASVDLDFHVPMLADLPVEKVGIGVKAQVTGFAVSLGHLRLSDGTVAFDIDNTHLHQSGAATLADSRFTFDWTEDFNSTDPITTRVAAKGMLTEPVRAALGIDIGKVITGSMPVNATLSGHRGQLVAADTAIDLTPATIAVPILNLGKAAGETASGHIVVNFAAGDVVSGETIHIGGPTLTATGTAAFDKTGTLTKLDFPTVKMGPLNDLSFTLARGAAGDDYTLRGHALDGSKLGRSGSSDAPNGGAVPKPGDDAPEGPFHISAHLDRVAMREGVVIAPFAMDLTGIGNRPGTLSMQGTLGKSAPLAATVEAAPQGRELTLTTGDAGLLAKGMFAFDGMRGGALSLNATLPGKAGDPDVTGPSPDFQGTLAIANFKVTNQPFLARLFSAGSLTGMGDLMQGEGISMEKLELPFTSKNNVISINGGRVTGRAIGATADGYIDRPKNQVALKGSLVPAYGLNSVLGNVPLLGDLLVSKKGEGVFGITYSLTGNADQPSLSVNPLSVLTPGILRRIFEGHIPTAANAPSNASPATPANPSAASPPQAQAKPAN